MKRAFFSCLILAAAAIPSSYAASQEAPTTGPAGNFETPAVPAETALAAPKPPFATETAAEPIADELPALPPPTAPAASPPAGTPPRPSALPPTIPGPSATSPPATEFPPPSAGSSTPHAANPLARPPQPQDPAAEVATFLKDGLQFTGPALPGNTIEGGMEGNPRYIASQNVAITWSEGKDVAWGYSKSVGRWAKQSLDPPATKAHEVPILTNNLVVWSTGTAIYGFSGTLGRWSKQSLDPPATKEMPALNDGVAVLQIGATFYGFSGATARWDVLNLPAGSKATFAVDDEYALVTDREDLYTFSAATGRWSSPQDATPQIGEATVSDASGASVGSEVRTFHLKHANAVTLEQTLLRQLFADELRLGANHTGLGDTIIARGKPEALDQLEALLKVLDRPARPATGSGRSPGSMGGGYGGDMGAEDAMMMEGMSGMPGGMPAGPASRTQLVRSYEQAEQRAAELARQLRENQPRGGSGQSPAALEQAVAQAFAARQRLHQRDLSALENRLQSTRETLEMRERIKQQIIERRVSDLLNPNLEWDAPPTAAAPTLPANESVESPSNPQGLLALQSQTGRFHKLQERWDVVFALYKGGRVDIGEALRAAAEVYEAEAAIAATSAARVQAAERHVERARGLQEIVEAKFRHEVEPVQAKLAAEAAVLNAEAILVTAQDTANRMSTRPATSPGPTTETTDIPPVLKLVNDLRGTWLQVAQEHDGIRTEAKPGTVFTLTFDGNRYTLRDGTEKYHSGTYKIGSALEHGRELDTVRTWLPGETEETLRPHRDLGLVDLREGRLIWCSGGMRPNERPDKLQAKKDDGRVLTEWRRVSFEPLSDEQFQSIDLQALSTETDLAPSSASPPILPSRVRQPAAPNVSGATNLPPALQFANNLRGTWLQLAQERNGEASLVKPGTIFTLTFDGNRYTLRQGAEKYASGTFKVGSEVGNSRELDTVRTWLKGETDETQRPQQELGLAHLNENTLQWCYGGMRANERPDKLATKKDDGRLLTEWRRFSEDPLSDEQFRSIDLTSIAPPTATGEAVRVRITGLGGVTCVSDASDEPGSRSVTLSKTSDLSIRPEHSLTMMLSTFPGRWQLQLSAHLEVPALSARASKWAGLNYIPLQIASEDLDQAAADGSVVMVVYLPHGTNEQAYPVMVSTRQSPGIDAVEEAKKRGDVLVALTLSNVVSAAEDGDRGADLPPAAARSPSSVPSAETNRIPANDSPLILARPEEFQQRLSELHHMVETAKRIVDQHKENAAAGNPQPQRFVDNALANLRSWQNKLDLARAEYAAQMKLLDSNLQSAEIAADAAEISFGRATMLFERGATPASSLDEVRLAAQETKARVQRAKTLLELYGRVDALSRPAAKSTPDEPASPAKE
jgi:uncharacterized protein (TIGR03067 family)